MDYVFKGDAETRERRVDALSFFTGVPVIAKRNTGKRCYKICNKQSGTCPFCGSKGKCCKKFSLKRNECDRGEGGFLKHVCV